MNPDQSLTPEANEVNVTRYSIYRNSTTPRYDNVKKDVAYLNVALVTYAKRSTTNRFLLANELLALRLGEALNLPVAAGVPVKAPTFSGDTPGAPAVYWGSLAIRESPPPAICEDLVAANAELATGIVVFDAWIRNIDRSERNLFFDGETQDVVLFDHGDALCNCVGPSFLTDNRDCLGFSGIHAVAQELTSFYYLDTWLSRLWDIESSLITALVRSCTHGCLTVGEQSQLAFELDRRRRTLERLFKQEENNKDIFMLIEPSLFNSNDQNGNSINYQI